MDPHIARYLTDVEDTHLDTALLSDMEALATALDITVEQGEHSLARPDDTIQVRRGLPRIVRRADAAHEIVHVLMDRGGHTKRIREYHVTVPDLVEHEELLTEHGADRLLMPKILLDEVLEHCGYNARAVYELSRFADVTPEQALRRVIFRDTTMRAAGFIASGTHIMHVEATHHSPVWYGQRLPEPNITYEALTLFTLPERPRRLIGLFDLSCAAD